MACALPWVPVDCLTAGGGVSTTRHEASLPPLPPRAWWVEVEGAGEMRDADAGEGADDGAATGASPAERSMIASSGFMGAV